MTPEQLADVVMSAVKVATAPLVERLKTLEGKSLIVGPQGETGAPGEKGADGRNGEPGPPGEPGKDADPELVLALKSEIAELRTELLQTKSFDVSLTLKQMVDEAFAAMPKPVDGRDGKDVDPATVEALVAQKVEKAVAAIPLPKDGTDGTSVSVDDVAPLITGEVAKAVAALPAPDLTNVITAQVEKAVAAIPPPKDGRSVTVDDVAPLIVAEVQKSVAALPVPKDGLGVKTAVVDRAGHLLLTMTDGAEKDLGSVVGEDGKPGRDGMPGLPGEDGKDGLDGLGFDDIQVDGDGERSFAIKFVRGEKEKAYPVTFATVLDRGVYQAGKLYEKGDGVSFGGSFFIAQAPTMTKPESSTDWRMAVKRGRDGRDGRLVAEPSLPVVTVGKR